MKNKLLGLILVAMTLTIVGLLVVVSKESKIAQGSTFVGQDYLATSTRYFPGASLTNLTLIKNGSGTVARITITGANTGVVRLWNATTSNVNLRTGNPATSSLKFIELPASLVAGVYDFDVEFNTGILYELVSGNAPTSTIIYR